MNPSDNSDEEQTPQGAQGGAYGQSSSGGQQPWVQFESPQQQQTSTDDLQRYQQRMARVEPLPPPPGLSRRAPVSQMLEGLDENDYIVLNNRRPESYTFTLCLGKGSYSSVYQGINQSTQTPVAIKVSKAGTGFSITRTLNEEYDILSELIQFKHKNILEYFDLLIVRGVAYFISELAIGDLQNILQVVNSSGVKVWKPLREPECRYIIRGMAEGLNHLHDLLIAHGDLKLANVLMFWKVRPNQMDRPEIQRYDRMIPKLADFGSSAFRNGEYDPDDTILAEVPTCTITYAAPETYFPTGYGQYEGLYDMIPADCYSLGNCLLNMLLGSQPFKPPIDLPYRDDPNAAVITNNYRKFMINMKRDIKFVESLCTGLPPQLRTALLELLDPIPENRMTVKQFLADQWLNSQKSSEAEDTFQPNQLGRSLFRSKEWN